MWDPEDKAQSKGQTNSKDAKLGLKNQGTGSTGGRKGQGAKWLVVEGDWGGEEQREW